MNNHYGLVRHGSTASNENSIFMGKLDIPLSRDGIEDAIDLRSEIYCKYMKFDMAFSSPLSRAYYTALIVLNIALPIFDDEHGTCTFVHSKDPSYNMPLIIDPRLSERSLGDLQGRSKNNYVDRYPKYNGRNVTRSFDDKPDGGESFSDIEKMVFAFFDDLEKQFSAKRILVFSHNGPLRLARKYFEGLSNEETLKCDVPHCTLLEYPKM